MLLVQPIKVDRFGTYISLGGLCLILCGIARWVKVGAYFIFPALVMEEAMTRRLKERET